MMDALVTAAIPFIPADGSCEETDVYIEDSDCELTDRYEESWSDMEQESPSKQGSHGTENLSTEIYPCLARRQIDKKITSKSRIRPRRSIFKKRLATRSRGESAQSSRSTFCVAHDDQHSILYEHGIADAQSVL